MWIYVPLSYITYVCMHVVNFEKGWSDTSGSGCLSSQRMEHFDRKRIVAKSQAHCRLSTTGGHVSF